MVETEMKRLLTQIQNRQCEEQTIEVKSAHGGCPEKLYDTLSSFSNQDSGGILVFGLDEKDGFAKVGVYDAQDLQRKVMEYGEQMTPWFGRSLRCTKKPAKFLSRPKFRRWT